MTNPRIRASVIPALPRQRTDGRTIDWAQCADNVEQHPAPTILADLIDAVAASSTPAGDADATVVRGC